MRTVLPDLTPRPRYTATIKVAPLPAKARPVLTRDLKPAPCPYCGKTMYRFKGMHPQRATKDHVMPRSRGGKHHEWVTACHACNDDKSCLTLVEWRAVLSLRNRRIHIFYFERLIPRVIVTEFYSLISPYVTRLATL